MDTEQLGIIIQTFSVIIAMVASLASWRVANITNKQYKLNQKTSENQTKPVFIIEDIFHEDYGLFLSIENVGFPSFLIKEVNSSNDKIRIDNYFNGQKSTNVNGRKSNEEKTVNRFFIKIFFEKDITEKSIISLNGIDVNGYDFSLKPPEFIIENGELINRNQINKQYLMEGENSRVSKKNTSILSNLFFWRK